MTMAIVIMEYAIVRMDLLEQTVSMKLVHKTAMEMANVIQVDVNVIQDSKALTVDRRRVQMIAMAMESVI